MTAADKIRAALSETLPKGATQVMRESGVDMKAVCQFFTYSSRKGELIRHGDRPHLYTLNPDYKREPNQPTREKLDKPSLTKKALQQLVASGRLLRNAIRSNVDGYEANDDLVAALDMQERAEELARAVVA